MQEVCKTTPETLTYFVFVFPLNLFCNIERISFVKYYFDSFNNGFVIIQDA